MEYFHSVVLVSKRSEDFLLTLSRVVLPRGGGDQGCTAPHLALISQNKGEKEFFVVFFLISASLLAFLDYEHFGCCHLKKVTWTQPCDCQFNHRLLPRIYNKEKEKELSFMSSFLLWRRSITVYKSQLYRIMWQNTWLMYSFEELRITQWEIAHFLLFLIFIIIWVPHSVF